MNHDYFASCAKLLEGLLKEELIALGITELKETIAGVYFTGSLENAYRVCLWSRLANQVLLTLAEFEAIDGDALYDAIQKIDWSAHFNVTDSFRIDVTGTHAHITHPHFIAQRAKDAIVDQFREHSDERPSIDRDEPAVCLHLHVHGKRFSLSLNLSGNSLHRRGYRLDGGLAPLKETLAAGILYRAAWPKQLTLSPAILFDPMCGSGTLLIEAALMAFDIAPSLLRSYFGFLGWKQHQPELWDALITEAHSRKEKGLTRSDVILIGCDYHPQAMAISLENSKRAGVAQQILFTRADATDYFIPKEFETHTGLIVTNPPYGERMHSDDIENLKIVFTNFGKRLQHDFMNWQLALFSGAPIECLKSLGFRLKKDYAFFNGSLACKLYCFDLHTDSILLHETPIQKQQRQVETLLARGLSEGAQILANRLRKNIVKLAQLARKENLSSYRLYDVDLPEYAVSVDFYEGQWLHVQEYLAPKEIDPLKVKQRLLEVIAVLHQECKISTSRIFLKMRQRQKGSAQYEKQGESGEYHMMQEGLAKCWVNFTDYLDTGIFLDHRRVRAYLAERAHGKRFLNLFAYTCTASVQALLHGAAHVTNVDLSRTYLDWGCENFALNKLPIEKHDFIQDDCLEWIFYEKKYYDVIFLNPPTFSNSKRMNQTLDIERDHVELLTLCLKRLTPEGILIFSTNAKNFVLDQAALQAYKIKDISKQTLAADFAKRENMHHVWEFSAN